MKKTICLITPPSAFLLDDRVFATLGILKVAAVLLRNGWNVPLLDLSGVRNFLDVIKDYISNSSTDIFGITATSPQLPAAASIMRLIREMRPQAKIILGGPHVTLVNAAARGERARNSPSRATIALEFLSTLANVLVAGDGEHAVLVAVDPTSPPIVDADIRTSPLFLTNETLEETEWPARELLDLDSYHYSIDGERATSLIAQLGCPFKCGFCGGRKSPSLRNIRTRSSENVVDEMVHLYRTYGFKAFMMYDDELNVNQKMLELMRLIGDAQRELGVSWRLRGFIKSELFKPEQAAAMYNAGFRWILVGFESGSPRILTNIQKMATREENTRCLQIAHENKLKVKALMSMGHPGETPETVAETKRWLLETRPDDFDLTVITTYPGTPYYDEAVELPDKTWMYTAPSGDKLFSISVDFADSPVFYKGVPGEYRSLVHTENLTPEDIVRLRDATEKEVRETLGIPYNQGAAAINFEHSMGQGVIPPNILRVGKPPLLTVLQ